MKNNQLIKHFSPMWFAASMGIGGTANLMYQLGSQANLFKVIGLILAGLNILVFIAMLIPWILRWFVHYDTVMSDVKHPVSSNFFVTMPVAMMLIATHVIMMGSSYIGVSSAMTIAVILWSIGVVLVLAFSITTTFNMMKQESIHPQMSNFSWFISPVASIVVPLLGNNLVKYYALFNIPLASFLNVIDIAFYGIGFLLFIILLSIVLNRFLFHQMPPAMVLPSFWIILGPIGVGTMSLMGIADASAILGLITDVQGIHMLALALWGFGIWALVLISVITINYVKEGKIPFSISWWAFIFPLAAFTLSSLSIAQVTQVNVIKYFGFAMTAILSIIFLMTLFKTIVGVFNKTLLLPKQNTN